MRKRVGVAILLRVQWLKGSGVVNVGVLIRESIYICRHTRTVQISLGHSFRSDGLLPICI